VSQRRLLAAPFVLETWHYISTLAFLPAEFKYFLELNYPQKLTHDKDYQWLKYIKGTVSPD
jgi:hypothetical protein